MSKILNLAKDFEQKSKQQANDIEQSLKVEFSRHERSIIEELSESERIIKSAIQDQNQTMKSLVLKSWLWMVLSISLVLIGCMGVIWWQGKIIAQNQEEISRQKSELEKLNAQTWGVSLYQWEKERYIVIPEGYTVKSGWTMNDEKNELIKLVEK